MNLWKSNSTPLISVLIGTAILTLTSVQAHEKKEVADFGAVDFAISCKPEVYDAFNSALAQLHNMMYIEAEQMFNDAAKTDPDCAMLQWGVAMSNFHPLWPGGQNDSEFERGAAAVKQAATIGTLDAREQAYIDAVSAMYAQDGGSYAERREHWAELQASVYQQFPDDEDAAALYALSHIAIAPKSDKTLKNQKEAGELLTQLHKQHPSHPAGFHYLIHAYDNPLLASKAEEVSRAYDKLAPTVPHALHMPSHIFVRMGLWEETVFWNERSAQAALDAATDSTTSHYAHAIDYKIYAHLQRGEEDIAAKDLAAMNAITNHQSAFSTAYALSAGPARLALESEDWKTAANVPVRPGDSIDWDKFPGAEAISHFSRGLGAARIGDIESAQQSIDTLADLRELMQARGTGYWATLADSQHKSVSAWVAFMEDDKDNALGLMKTAADVEDSVDKSPVTPGAVLPARELYGEMLSLVGNHKEALEAYETALNISPNRTRSLIGAMEAAAEIGDTEKEQLMKQAVKDVVAKL